MGVNSGKIWVSNDKELKLISKVELLYYLDLGYARGMKKRTREEHDRIQTKIKSTWIMKYGTDNPNKTPEMRLKISTTKLNKTLEEKELINLHYRENCLLKYGVDNPSKLLEVIDKRKETCLEKYGEVSNLCTEETKEKIKKTCLEKYGVEYATQSEVTKNKTKQNNLEKYGVEYPSQLLEFLDKAKLTRLMRYGDENYNNREKAAQTCIDRYGVANPLLNPEIMEKSKNTCIERYGVEHPNSFGSAEYLKLIINKYGTPYVTQVPEIRLKQLNTCLEHYGVLYPVLSEVVLKKIKETCLEKYGVDSFSKTEQFAKCRKSHFLYDSQNFDSLPELAVYMYFKINDVPIERHPCRIIYTYNNIEHTYFPDFKINEKLIEIKGDLFFDNGKMINPFDRSYDELYEAKYNCAIANGVIFWTSDNYRMYVDWFNKNYNKEEFKRI